MPKSKPVKEKKTKKSKKKEYIDDGITKLEVWDENMHVYRYTLDADAHFVEKVETSDVSV